MARMTAGLRGYVQFNKDTHTHTHSRQVCGLPLPRTPIMVIVILNITGSAEEVVSSILVNTRICIIASVAESLVLVKFNLWLTSCKSAVLASR